MLTQQEQDDVVGRIKAMGFSANVCDIRNVVSVSVDEENNDGAANFVGLNRTNWIHPRLRELAAEYDHIWVWVSADCVELHSIRRRAQPERRTNFETTRSADLNKAAIFRDLPVSKPGAKVRFTSATKQHGSASPTVNDIQGLRDAFTGKALNPALGLFQCDVCFVYYHTETRSALLEHNGGCWVCVACGASSLSAVTVQRPRWG